MEYWDPDGVSSDATNVYSRIRHSIDPVLIRGRLTALRNSVKWGTNGLLSIRSPVLRNELRISSANFAKSGSGNRVPAHTMPPFLQ
jgi:hypothetical protein